ncbi:strigolactone esterase D14-like [Phalaenopsis equestris]|uniref:strigolactone esterase D14-like n=1 Tax=Phalaenopsis equestris TaxID=78828 RepID=UPI0009E6321F|nr:strigolactone esterase D14-like [Phalaenopsis equestris]
MDAHIYIYIYGHEGIINSDDYQGGFQLTEVENILGKIKTNFQAWAEEFTPIALGINDHIPLQKLIDSFKRMNQKAALPLAKMIFLGDQRHVLEHVKVPCTIIQGTKDKVVPIAVGDYMKSKLKGGTSLEYIENQAHFPQITSPEKFIEIIEKVLDK